MLGKKIITDRFAIQDISFVISSSSYEIWQQFSKFLRAQTHSIKKKKRALRPVWETQSFLQISELFTRSSDIMCTGKTGSFSTLEKNKGAVAGQKGSGQPSTTSPNEDNTKVDPI